MSANFKSLSYCLFQIKEWRIDVIAQSKVFSVAFAIVKSDFEASQCLHHSYLKPQELGRQQCNENVCTSKKCPCGMPLVLLWLKSNQKWQLYLSVFWMGDCVSAAGKDSQYIP